MKKFTVRIETLSPLHLGAGRADVVIDAEVVHDEFGMPYFPAKRLKGLLYESAVELVEMYEEETTNVEENIKKTDKKTKKAKKASPKEESFTLKDVHELFNPEEGIGFTLENLCLEKYDNLYEGWRYLMNSYPEVFTPKDVLASYSDIRYQTKINKDTGTAEDTTLHNMRLVDAGIVFEGGLELYADSDKNRNILKDALLNLRYAGAKRNRGCGHIKCEMK